jgi:hypothetical protein
VGTEVKGIAPSLVRDFAQQARMLDAGELKNCTPAKRYTLLLSLIRITKARARDAVAGTAVKRIATIFASRHTHGKGAPRFLEAEWP